MSDALSAEAAVIQVSSRPCGDAPLIVHRETLLGELTKGSECRSRYVLVSDDDDRIIGVVRRSEIDRRLNTGNQTERSRWQAVPIDTMSKLSFSDDPRHRQSITKDTIECTTIREGDSLFGVAVEGDLFLSWRRLESLFNAALSDPLTGLTNRLAYERRLAEEWSRAIRTKMSIGIVVVDLDHFKDINDTHGHAVGDEVLTQVGQKLELSMRSYDVVARFGGDEFVALCLGCAPGDVEIPVSRLRRSLEEINVTVGGQRLKVAASVGAAVRHGDFLDSKSEDLFTAADDCLYRAKKSSERAWKIEFEAGNEPVPEPVSRECFSPPNVENIPNVNADVHSTPGILP
ncbi:MAG: GGDEF domain-containing protein [Fuerstiella sp.]|nr:GGDEF domain-containing protein [Fuerstiella sp.]MCP4853683.1 GGDEF domain-containing protein [Fuerstiella sp.]